MLVFCGKAELTDPHADTITNPKVIVEILRKTHDNEWILRTHVGLDALVAIESLGISLSLGEVYAGVDLTSAR